MLIQMQIRLSYANEFSFVLRSLKVNQQPVS